MDVAVVVRLVTVVDIDERNFPMPLVGDPVVDGPVPEGVEPAVAPPIERPDPDYDCNMGFSALHLAVLDDGRRLTLLDDRGWGGHGPPGIWSQTSVEEIEQEARMVVGPDADDPEVEAWHWAHLADVLREQRVLVDAGQLRPLPHDVELSEQVRSRITGT